MKILHGEVPHFAAQHYSRGRDFLPNNSVGSSSGVSSIYFDHRQLGGGLGIGAEYGETTVSGIGQGIPCVPRLTCYGDEDCYDIIVSRNFGAPDFIGTINCDWTIRIRMTSSDLLIVAFLSSLFSSARFTQVSEFKFELLMSDEDKMALKLGAGT